MNTVTQLTPVQIQAAVKRGAFWMSKQNRLWFKKVNPELLDIADSSTSPVAMAISTDWDEHMPMERAEWLGLAFPRATPATIELANKYWKAEVRATQDTSAPVKTRRTPVRSKVA